MLAMTSEFDNKMAYTKELISVLDCVQLEEVDDVDTLRVLWF